MSIIYSSVRPPSDQASVHGRSLWPKLELSAHLSRLSLTRLIEGPTVQSANLKMIDFKNLIIGKHEGRVVFVWNSESGIAVLGAFLGIRDGIEGILSRREITPAQRAILEDLRTLAGSKNWDFATLRESFL